jgi:phosphoribosyl-ATP pyrophosphohydrolase/phosphoribosyl-AMP cyclohydrolase
MAVKPKRGFDLDALDFAKGDGRVTVVTQDFTTGAVLMVAQADRVALALTIATGEMHYTSRTRGLWHKGATSGNRQVVRSLTADCDGDAVLARVVPLGPACHTGDPSCFDDALAADGVARLDATIASRGAGLRAMAGPDPRSYTHRLLGDRNLRLKKLGEEIAEFLVACADEDSDRVAAEGADVVYHLLVALHGVGLDWDAVRGVLVARSAASDRP